MTSVQGTDPSMMYQTESYLNREIPIIHKDTILGKLSLNPDCSSFASLIRTLPDMAAKLNHSQASITLFVPITNIKVMDSYQARLFLQSHIVDKHLLPIFFNKRFFYINSRLPYCKILSENMDGMVLLNHRAFIVGNEIIGNSIIYYINNTLIDTS